MSPTWMLGFLSSMSLSTVSGLEHWVEGRRLKKSDTCRTWTEREMRKYIQFHKYKIFKTLQETVKPRI